MKSSDMDRMSENPLNRATTHQEESKWPTLEGMVLKKNFDDVFECPPALEAFKRSSWWGRARKDLAEFGRQPNSARSRRKIAVQNVQSTESMEKHREVHSKLRGS
jgi:hypothetical protein